jgi:hypothetical protein
MAYLTNKMNENTHPFNSLIEWIADNWRYIAGFGLASQFIDRFFKWLTKRSEARIKEIYLEQYEVTAKPEIKELTESINELRKVMWRLEDKIKQ